MVQKKIVGFSERTHGLFDRKIQRRYNTMAIFGEISGRIFEIALEELLKETPVKKFIEDFLSKPWNNF